MHQKHFWKWLAGECISLILPPGFVPGHKLWKLSKESGIFQSLGTIRSPRYRKVAAISQIMACINPRFNKKKNNILMVLGKFYINAAGIVTRNLQRPKHTLHWEWRGGDNNDDTLWCARFVRRRDWTQTSRADRVVLNHTPIGRRICTITKFRRLVYRLRASTYSR